MIDHLDAGNYVQCSYNDLFRTYIEFTTEVFASKLLENFEEMFSRYFY